jgi:hypothetical protein
MVCPFCQTNHLEAVLEIGEDHGRRILRSGPRSAMQPDHVSDDAEGFLPSKPGVPGTLQESAPVAAYDWQQPAIGKPANVSMDLALLVDLSQKALLEIRQTDPWPFGPKQLIHRIPHQSLGLSWISTCRKEPLKEPVFQLPKGEQYGVL